MLTEGVVIFVNEIWAIASEGDAILFFGCKKPLPKIRKPPRPSLSSKTPLLFHSPQKFWNFFSKSPRSHMATKPFSSKNPSLLPIDDDVHRVTDVEASVSPQEWQGWGTISPVPSMVNRAINDLNLLQKDISASMTFGNYGKLSVSHFIYNHGWALALMREHTNRELIRPAATRFATSYLTLQSMYSLKDELERMFTSHAWSKHYLSRSDEAKNVKNIVLRDKYFWPSVAYAIKTTKPLVSVLRMTDSEKMPGMGFIYGSMDEAKEAIAKALGGEETSYKEIWDIIDRKWEFQMHRHLHAAAYYLNQHYHYEADVSTHPEIKLGLFTCSAKLFPDPKVQEEIDLQMDYFHLQKELFGFAAAKSTTKKRNPVDWWIQYGDETPELTTFAVKVLSLTCSSSACEPTHEEEESFTYKDFEQGGFKLQEDRKHRAKYASLSSSEEKLQFYSARQIACRLLGSRGYLCQKCWLPLEDCMCSRVTLCSLWQRMRIWLYMHPKDFLRQNNTGKLLWQVFGVEAASLCLFGIAEAEEIMWNELNHAGRNMVCCLYPNKNAVTESVKDSVGCVKNLESQAASANESNTMHFILIDGTWSNSGAMFRRLKDRAGLEWKQELRCISLHAGASLMHKLRPQPSWDKTCTAAAAIGLLHELQLVPELSSFGLEKAADAVENGLEVLFEALTARRLRMGRSISRRERHNTDIC